MLQSRCICSSDHFNFAYDLLKVFVHRSCRHSVSGLWLWTVWPKTPRTEIWFARYMRSCQSSSCSTNLQTFIRVVDAVLGKFAKVVGLLRGETEIREHPVIGIAFREQSCCGGSEIDIGNKKNTHLRATLGLNPWCAVGKSPSRQKMAAPLFLQIVWATKCSADWDTHVHGQDKDSPNHVPGQSSNLHQLEGEKRKKRKALSLQQEEC